MNKIIINRLKDLENIFIEKGSKQEKEKKEKYLLNKFPFYGLKKPQLKELSKEFLFFVKKQDKQIIVEIILYLSKKDEREWIYVIIFIFENNLKKFNEKDDLYLIKDLITINSWWDSVDSYSGIVLSKILLKFNNKKVTNDFLIELNSSENIWLQRSSLLGQLKFKNKWDFELQKRLILNVASNKDFWIQKAIGWTLREFAKNNAEDLVVNFIEKNKNKLSNLAAKEALRNIIK